MSASAPGSARRTSRRRLGASLIVLGVATIVGAVLWVLEAANGPGRGPRTFATRRSYDQVKVAVHDVFPAAFAVGLAGLGLALVGGRLCRRAATSGDRGSTGPL